MEAAAATKVTIARLRLPSIDTPYGPAIQATNGEAFALVIRTLEGKPLYKVGDPSHSRIFDAQFWSPLHPAAPNYTGRLGIPPANVPGINFVEAGTIREGVPFITRVAPGVGTNFGGELEVVVVPYGAEVQTITVIRKP